MIVRAGFILMDCFNWLVPYLVCLGVLLVELLILWLTLLLKDVHIGGWCTIWIEEVPADDVCLVSPS